MIRRRPVRARRRHPSTAAPPEPPMSGASCTREPDVEYDTVSVLRHCSWMLRRLLPLDHRLRRLDAACDVGGDLPSAPVHIKDKEQRIDASSTCWSTRPRTAPSQGRPDAFAGGAAQPAGRDGRRAALTARREGVDHAHLPATPRQDAIRRACCRQRAERAERAERARVPLRPVARQSVRRGRQQHAAARLVNQLRSMPSAYALADSHVLAQCTQDAVLAAAPRSCDA